MFGTEGCVPIHAHIMLVCVYVCERVSVPVDRCVIYAGDNWNFLTPNKFSFDTFQYANTTHMQSKACGKLQ